MFSPSKTGGPDLMTECVSTNREDVFGEYILIEVMLGDALHKVGTVKTSSAFHDAIKRKVTRIVAGKL